LPDNSGMDCLSEIMRAQEEAKRPLCDQVRARLLEAIGLLADAANHPIIARRQIETAHEYVKQAYAAARELDPDEGPDYGRDDEFHPPHGPLTNHDLTEDQRLDMPRTI